MKKKECRKKDGQQKVRQQRFALTLLFTGMVLCFILATLLVVAGVLFVVIEWNVFGGLIQTELSAGDVIGIFVLSAFLVGSVMTYFLSKIPLKPVNTLINQMNRLSAGDYKARIDFGELWGKHPSIAELTDSFNQMAKELQSTEMLRSDFVNNFSHEFKTPIVSISGFTKLLRKGNLTEEQKEEYLQIIEEESLRLSQMATNVLSLTKIENQAILTDVTRFNLSEQLRSCILLLNGKWEKKGIEFILDFDEYDVDANEELLKQVWINLIDNAVKFSPENGMIELELEETEDELSVAVINSGAEIPPEQQKKIFNKFYQGDESHATEGNGIGLAIVKRVAELHNGSVAVQSEKGVTKFTVTLPKN